MNNKEMKFLKHFKTKKTNIAIITETKKKHWYKRYCGLHEYGAATEIIYRTPCEKKEHQSVAWIPIFSKAYSSKSNYFNDSL